MNRSRATAIALMAMLAGCAARNPPLPHRFDADPHDYRYEHLAREDPANGEDTFIILTFSGGGTRAAAFAYGVSRALYEQPLADGRRLLDEVDVISSVSGGSFAAAYLGLFGARRFVEEFPDAVLYRPIERALIARLLAPWNWVQLVSPRFSRSDVAAAYYDRTIFEGKTFHDLPRRRPFIVMNATDIAEGAQFSFTQDHFDRLCSQLDPIPVARGVTASSAFPVAFPPITLTNYPGALPCAYEPPTWVTELETDPDTNPPGYALAKTWLSYGRPTRRYVHLSDGGLSDNIGLRAPYNALSVNQWTLGGAFNEHRIEKLVIITVDAKPKGESPLDGSPRPASWPAVLNAAATNPIENYSADTIELVRAWFSEWDDAARRYDRTQKRCGEFATDLCSGATTGACYTERRQACLVKFGAHRPVPHPTLYRVHLRFDAIADPAAKSRLEGVGTRLQLPREDVDALVQWGGELLRKSPAYQELVRDLGAEP